MAFSELTGLLLIAGPLFACGAETSGEGSSALNQEREESVPSAQELPGEDQGSAELEAVEPPAWAAEWPMLVERKLRPRDAFWVSSFDGALAGKTLLFEAEWNQPKTSDGPAWWQDVERELHPTQTILDLQRQLSEHKIDFLVVPVPTRLELYPELIVNDAGDSFPSETWGAKGFSGWAPGVTGWIEHLRESGVQVVDLLSPFAERRFPAEGELLEGDAEQLFLKYNMHWTPRGAQLAAEQVGSAVRGLPNFETAQWKEGAGRQVLPEAGTWEPKGRKPEGTVPEELIFRKVVDAAGKPLSHKRPNSSILLLGDSFSTHYEQQSACFAQHLAHQLEQPFDSIVVRGGGVKQTRSSLKRRKQNGMPDKRIVIWMFSVTTLIDEAGRDWAPVDFFSK